MKKKLILFFVTIFLLLFFLILYIKYPTIFLQFENKINDIYFITRGEKKADKSIVIVDIDEKSLKELGQWPWSRNKIAKIITNITNAGAGIIGLDILFAEPDNSSPKTILSKLGIKKKNIEDYDAILAETIKKTPTVVGYVFSLKNDGIQPKFAPNLDAVIIEKNKPKHSYIIKAYRAILNIPLIQKNANANGYFNTIPDNDGVVRSIPMLIKYKNNLYPSLSLEMIRNAMQTKFITLNYENNSITSISIGNITIPTDIYGRMSINYSGPQKKYKYISAADVYYNKINKSLFKNKFVLIGTSAAGLLDLRSTPFDAAYPGVEVHANALDNMINQNFISTPIWASSADLASMIVIGFIVFGLLFIPNIFLSIASLVILNIVFLYLHYYLMFSKGIILNTLFPMLYMNILFFTGTTINLFYENRQKKLIKSKFAKKVSSAVVEELLKDKRTSMEEEREITIFFSDIRDFTRISEQIGSAKELITLLNDYMTPMVDIITKHNGTVDKFIGDAIMAYWNAPVNVELHADTALEASIEQIIALKKLNDQFFLRKRPHIDIGIGLNSGKSIVGEMGSLGRSDYTCIGDAVNLASRSEGLCKLYGAKIVLTQFTKELLRKKGYLLRELDIVKVKGKSKAVKVYECMGDTNNFWVNISKESIEKYHEALKLYRKSDFKKALWLFEKLYSGDKQKLYKLYVDRCKYFIKNPPANFEGVWTLNSK